MSGKSRDQFTPPSDWVDLLDRYDPDLTRVRMLWRRGSGRYRPLIPLTIPLEELEGAPWQRWEELERDETNFCWTVVDEETDEERRERVATAAQELWSTAWRWTQAKGPICDFQLRGYGAENEILFEEGVRLSLARRDDGERERVQGPEPAFTHTHRPVDWREFDETKDNLIRWLVEERNNFFAMTRQATAAAPELIEKNSRILEQAINYQNEQVRALIDQHTGRTELQARAYKERQRTHRRDQTLRFLQHTVDSVMQTVVPEFRAAFETWAGVTSQQWPEFEIAQQAMAYLGHSLNQRQLNILFNNNKAAIRDFMRLLEEAASIDDERAALEHLHGADILFKSDRFLSVATSEQEIAGRRIIHRMAWYRMGDYGE